MALQLVAVASLLAGPMDYLRPYDKFAGDQKALLEQLERDKAAKSGSPLVPPADECCRPGGPAAVHILACQTAKVPRSRKHHFQR